MIDLRNKKVTVIGLGESGLTSAQLLYGEGAVVSVTDSGNDENVRKNAQILEERYIDVEIGQHTKSFLTDTELLIVSPGVENSSLPIRFAQENQIPIMSELELGYIFCKGIVVAVTGTNGKSTVVSLIGEILHRAGKSVNICGNIGNPFTGEVKKIDKDTIAIVEVSSFQLEWIDQFRPKISVILNITEDHLDRYAGFEQYAKAKKQIFKNQRRNDFTILNYDDRYLRKKDSSSSGSKVLYFSTQKKVEGIYLENGSAKTYLRNKEKALLKLKDTKLKGKHNVENMLAALLASALLGIKPNFFDEAVRNFVPLPHRFEHVEVIAGIEFIDDSKATNVDSTYRAIESLDKQIILIVGGKDKNLSYDKIAPIVKNKVKKFVLIGETKHKIRDIFNDVVPIDEADTLEEAVNVAFKNASQGDCVLLSPMCSSFDMFHDYKHRGEIFRKAVEELRTKNKEN